jgi:hypothetical protein
MILDPADDRQVPSVATATHSLRRAVGYLKDSADSLLIAVLVCVPILFSPYRDDDIINAGLPQAIARGETTVWLHFLRFTSEWMDQQGRFFPGSVAWSTGVFVTFADRLAYKSLLFVLSLVCLLTVWCFVRWALGRRPGLPTVLVLSALWVIQPVGFDAITSFAGLLPLTMVCSLAGTMLLASRVHVGVVIGALLWALALTTYEVAILMVPALAWVLVTKRARRGALVLGGIAALDLVVVLLLRLRMAEPPLPGYSLSFDLSEWARTTSIQLAAALPWDSFWFARTTVDLSSRSVVLWVVAFSVVTVAGRLTSSPPHDRVRARSLAPLAAVGLSAWALPSILVGATARWQTELDWGSGYLSVVWGYVGLGILVAVSVELLLGARCVSGRSQAAATAVSVALAACSAVTFVVNLTSVVP